MPSRLYKRCSQVNFLRIIQWNVEGINSTLYGNKLMNEQFQNTVLGHDIIALTETQCGEDTPVSLPGYYIFRSTREKHTQAKKYSGGIAVGVKNNIKPAITQVSSRSKDIIWLRLQNNYFNLPNDMIIGVVYISPANSTYTKSLSETVWAVLEDELTQFNNNEQILITGDFNAHTACLPHYITNDDDKFTPVSDNYIADTDRVLHIRANMDEKVCAYGNQLLELCKMTKMRILNGRKLGDVKGALSCHKYNGSSTVDYFISDDILYNEICYMQVHDWMPLLSDHCPISMCMNVNGHRKKMKE